MKKFIILIPIFNDWKSVFRLLENIDIQTTKLDADISVMIFNDASTEKISLPKLKFKKIKSVRVVNMKQNRGHARCIAAGLKYITENEDFDYVIPMDGDGEDRPEELILLFNKSREYPLKTVTLDRIKRSEGLFFKLLYECHKVLTHVFTGKLVKFGNYSCLPKEDVIRLTKEAYTWSSFSGSITKVIFDRISVPSIRGQRYFGPSKMNLFNLLIHSFSIMAVFRDVVIIRAILFLLIYLFFVSNSFSIITLSPAFAILIFLLLIFKVSSRENIEELNNSLENVGSIDFLSDLNSR